MPGLTLTYFDFPGSRGEEVRLALAIAGVPFTDRRIDRAAFARLKPDLPFGQVPTLEVEGHGIFAQSNAILRLVGRLHGLHPEDPFEAARHDALMEAVEDIRQRIAGTMRMEDPAARRAARQALASDGLPRWAASVERLIGAGPFVAGARPSVADIKLHMIDRWISSGALDDIPAETLDAFPRLKALSEAVRSHPAVVAWYAKA
jgi:glutathione S-transferase